MHHKTYVLITLLNYIL